MEAHNNMVEFIKSFISQKHNIWTHVTTLVVGVVELARVVVVIGVARVQGGCSRLICNKMTIWSCGGLCRLHILELTCPTFVR